MQNIELDLTGRRLTVFIGCVAVFIAALVVSAITASKIYEIQLLGLSIGVPVGTSLFALAFLSTDVMSEVWTRKEAQTLILWGFFVRIGLFLFLLFAVAIPGAVYWDNQEAYSSVLTSSSRILLAGILTYPISQLCDIYIFHYLKKRHEGKNLLWLRNNVSTFFAQSVDSTVFILIAFFGIFPWEILVGMILGQIVIKTLIAMCDTPLVYIVRNYANNRKLYDFSG